MQVSKNNLAEYWPLWSLGSQWFYNYSILINVQELRFYYLFRIEWPFANLKFPQVTLCELGEACLRYFLSRIYSAFFLLAAGICFGSPNEIKINWPGVVNISFYQHPLVLWLHYTRLHSTERYKVKQWVRLINNKLRLIHFLIHFKQELLWVTTYINCSDSD